jgi:hypothetical protein
MSCRRFSFTPTAEERKFLKAKFTAELDRVKILYADDKGTVVQLDECILSIWDDGRVMVELELK